MNQLDSVCNACPVSIKTDRHIFEVCPYICDNLRCSHIDGLANKKNQKKNSLTCRQFYFTDNVDAFLICFNLGKVIK